MTVDGGSVDVAPVAPHESAHVRLPAGLLEGTAQSPAVLTVSAVLTARRRLGRGRPRTCLGPGIGQSCRSPPKPEATAGVKVEGDLLRLGPAVFERATGSLIRLGGIPVEGLRLLLWRAATDNDLGAEWGSPDPRPVATQWLDAGLNRMHTRLIGLSSRPAGWRRGRACGADPGCPGRQTVWGTRRIRLVQRRGQCQPADQGHARRRVDQCRLAGAVGADRG